VGQPLLFGKLQTFCNWAGCPPVFALLQDPFGVGHAPPQYGQPLFPHVDGVHGQFCTGMLIVVIGELL
jgi:hypothetical protein